MGLCDLYVQCTVVIMMTWKNPVVFIRILKTLNICVICNCVLTDFKNNSSGICVLQFCTSVDVFVHIYLTSWGQKGAKR